MAVKSSQLVLAACLCAFSEGTIFVWHFPRFHLPFLWPHLPLNSLALTSKGCVDATEMHVPVSSPYRSLLHL